MESSRKNNSKDTFSKAEIETHADVTAQEYVDALNSDEEEDD